MTAIDFIKKDIVKPRPKLLSLIAIAASITLTAGGLGLILRKDFVEAFNTTNILPGCTVLLPIFIFYFLYADRKYSHKTKWLVYGVLFSLGVVASFSQPQTVVSLGKFHSPERFWSETLYCFSLGLVLGGMGTILISTLAWKFFPVPNQLRQFSIAAVSALFGVAGLTFHCMGALKTHILIGHWGEALLIFIFSLLVQRLLFVRKVKSALSLTHSTKGLYKVG